jgi:hypothetical protein
MGGGKYAGVAGKEKWQCTYGASALKYNALCQSNRHLNFPRKTRQRRGWSPRETKASLESHSRALPLERSQTHESFEPFRNQERLFQNIVHRTTWGYVHLDCTP